MSSRQWRDNYLDHRLIGTLARRLLWSVVNGKKRTAVVFSDDRFTDIDGEEVEITDKAVISLWHPITEDTSTIARWRERMLEVEITQPFKQTYRGIYRLTDAERNTETYSARFANHLLLQHQFNALATERRWKQTRGGSWDGGQENSACKSINDIDVEFEATGSEEHEFTSNGMYSCVRTGAVRFYQNEKPLKLESIDAQWFSELMRDIDLFTGVANIGNVADQLHIEGRFLHVKGELATYKIHLGSSNILMEPDDSYLCIVPGSTKDKSATVHLPFEGDAMLSAIISKAILLTNDTRIKDATILEQIDGGRYAAGA